MPCRLPLRHDQTTGIWFNAIPKMAYQCTLRVLSPAALSLMYGDTRCVWRCCDIDCVWTLANLLL